MLITNITQANYVMTISQAVTYENLRPHIKNADISYIAVLLGKTMYDKLVAFHDDQSKTKITSPSFSLSYNEPAEGETGPTKEDYMYSVLLWFAQHATLNLAYSIGFDMLNAFISDAGFRRNESTNQKSLFKYQEENLKRYFLKTGMDSMDKMLEIMEENVADVFTHFKATLDKIKSRIFPNTASFDAHYDIKNSRIIFTRLAQHIKTVEELTLEPIVGKANLQLILTELPKTTPDPKALAILPYLRDVSAYLSTVMLMEESGADISDRGLYFTGMRSIAESGLELPATEERIEALIQRNREIAERYITRLKRFMMDNEWQEPENPRTRMFERDNAGKKTFFA